MAMVLRKSRLRLTQAIYFGQAQAAAGIGTVTSVAGGNGIAATPSPIVGAGNIDLGTLTSNHDFGPFRIDSSDSVKWARAAAFATGGNGTSATPWTSPSGTGGIQEAVTSLGAHSGTVYAESGYYSITSGVDLTSNAGGFIGTGGGPSPGSSIRLVGDGPGNTIFVCGTATAPVFDLTGSDMWQMRAFAIVPALANPSQLGIFAARASVNAGSFNNLIDNVYMGFNHDAAANGGNGTTGIYLRAVEASVVSNTIIYADNPGVMTADDIFGLTSAFVPMSPLAFCSSNTLLNNQWSGYNQSVLMQGACDNTKIVNHVCLKFVAAPQGYAVRVLASTVSPALQIVGVQIKCQVEDWDRYLSTTALAEGWKIEGTISAPATGPTVQLVGANAGIFESTINVVGTAQAVLGDNGVVNKGARSNDIVLYAGQSIAAPATPPRSNFIRTYVSGPSIVWSAGDFGQLVQSLSSLGVGTAQFADRTALPAATGGSFYLGISGYLSPTLGRIYVGDGTGWQLDFAKRIGSVDTVLHSILDSGAVQDVGVAAPAVSALGSGRIYFDSGLEKYRVSMNGGAYVDLVGSGGVTGSGAIGKLAYWTAATNLTDEPNITLGGAFTLDINGDLNLATDPSRIRAQGNVALKFGIAASSVSLGVNADAAANSAAVGAGALGSGTSGADCTAVGTQASAANTAGDRSTSVGTTALSASTTGTDNTGVGFAAGLTNTTGSRNLLLGSSADVSAPNLSNAIAIGANAVVGASDSCRIGDGSMKVGIRTGSPALALDVAAAFGTRHLDIALVNGLNSNIALTDTSFVRITGPSAPFSVGAFSGGADGRQLTIYNTVAFQMTIVNEDLASVATSRITTLTGGNVVLRAGTSAATLIYDGTGDRWILLSTN